MICDRLKILLDELNISQRQFAIKINLDPGYFSRIVQGKVNPPDRILLLIENVFNVSKDWLENGQGEIFSNHGISLAKKQVLESIDSLNDEQVNAVSSFTLIRLLGITPKACYTLARIGSRSRRTSKVHSA